MQKSSLLSKSVVIVGGGLSGLISAILLARKNIPVTLVEKKQYPFHRVCGEYISNEVVPFLKANNLFPDDFSPASITNFELSAINGRSKTVPLGLGGFGISRYTFDQFLAIKAIDEGVSIINDQVVEINYTNNGFNVILKSNSTIIADLVLGAYGKRSKIDKQLKRRFISKSSPYIGVKYHIKHDYPIDRVALHNFPGGYCGINAIEEGKYNLCYLSRRDNLKEHKNIEKMEQEVLFKNPHLKKIFMDASFLFEKPEVINEISFETKKTVDHHILMCGDAAGMITPLCGNGMAMAIRCATIACRSIEHYFFQHQNRSHLEREYAKSWNQEFKLRLRIGRTIQTLFGKGSLSGMAVSIIKSKRMAKKIISMTHGDPFMK